MYIFVGSTNPVKVNSVTIAASETWPKVVVKGLDIQSGIADQPRSDLETKKGAENRAKAALKHGLRKGTFKKTTLDVIGVGLEGGVFDNEDELWSTVWAVVVDQQGNVSSSNGARFQVPPIVAKKIKKGEEMGPIVSQLVGEEEIRKKQGMIGVITKNFIDRTEEYTGIVKMALGLWYGRDWAKMLK